MKKRNAPAGIIIMIILAVWLLKPHQPATAPAPQAAPAAVSLPQNKSSAETRRERQGASGPREFAPYQVSGVSIIDANSGKTLSAGPVDLRPTLARIAAGERNPHRNDGSVFRNSGRKLPAKRAGYYREYVVPTEGVRGPGPQRLVLGREGEVYYTHDHYESFIELKGELKGDF